MLTLLAVRNVVLIEALDLEFRSGLTVLTGETGAGKSILLDALGLALGSRANFGLIGPAGNSAEVTAIFTPHPHHPVWDKLEAAGIDANSDEHHELIMRRRLRDGKSTALINDTPVGLNVMRECGDALVEIQGQFEGRGLLDLSTHGVLLDRFANHNDLLLACRNTWQGWQDAATQYETAAATRKDAEANAAWLKEAVEQLDQLAPEDNEESKLMEERDVLANVTRIADALSQVDHLINGDSGALSQIAQSSRQISRISDVAGSLTNDIEAALERAEVEISEVERALSTAQANLEGDPNRMIAVDDRLHDLRQQARKHEVEADHLLALHDDLRQRLASLEDKAGDLGKLAKARDDAAAMYNAAREAISLSRQSAASKLDALIMAELPPLKLEQARFITKVTPMSEQHYGPRGGDAIRFEASTNPGMAEAAIDQIASGGELARFLLALKVVLADSEAPATLIFDEVDAGVGGAVASSVGSRLARLGEQTQSIVITHSPQVAARGKHHYRISKSVAENGAISTTAMLDQDERVEELSRMLAGEKITDEAKAAARRLLEG